MQQFVSPGMRVLLVLLVTLAGFIDSAAGGGGLISLPAFMLSGMPAHNAYACNKFSAACGTTVSTLNYLRKGAADVPVGLVAAAGSFAGSALAARLVLLLSDRFLKGITLVVLPFVAAFIILRRNMPDEDTSSRRTFAQKVPFALAIGFAIGCYDGLVGPGTGTFAIIAYMGILGYAMRTAGGNAKLLNLASNYASLAVYLTSGLVLFSIAVPCAAGNILGNWLGSQLALKKGAAFIRPMLLVVVALLLIRLAFDLIAG